MITSILTKNEITFFGKTTWRNEGRPVGIYNSDRAFHLLCAGKTGCGKSHLIKLFLKSDLKHAGITIFDIHSEYMDFVRNNIPEHRKKDVIYLDIPNPNLKIGYNPLKKVSYEKRSLIASGILEVFERLNNANSWGPKLSHILRMVLLCLLDQPHQTTFSDILRVLRDREFRKGCIMHIINEDVKEFFTKEFPQYNPKFDFVPIYNKIGGFLAHPAIKRLLVDNVKGDISLRLVQDKKKILVININKASLGTDQMKLISSLLLTSIISASFTKLDLPKEKRVPHFLFLDEMGSYSNDISSIFEELRKAGLSVFGSIQHLEQLDDKLRSALFGNVGSLVIFRCSARDSSFYQNELYKDHLPIVPGDYVNLKKYNAYVRLMVRGQPTKPFSIQTLGLGDKL